nr:hypothetical protein [Tanacetum cinerariifolium]
VAAVSCMICKIDEIELVALTMKAGLEDGGRSVDCVDLRIVGDEL